jgi:hypothetical protein
MFAGFQFKGSAKWQLIDDKTGLVLKEGEANNHFTRWGRRHFFNTGGEGNKEPLGHFTYISDDPRDPSEMHPEYDNQIRQIQGTPNPYQNAGSAISWLNETTFTRTITHTYTSPSAARTIRWMGMLSAAGNTVPRLQGRSYTCLVTALPVDPPIVQSPGETFVMQYTVVAIPPSRKEFMGRFGMNYRAALSHFSAFLAHRGPNTSLQHGTYISPLTISPRGWYLDPDAVYGVAGNNFIYESNNGSDDYFDSGRETIAYGTEGARGGYLNVDPAIKSADGTPNGTWVGAIGLTVGAEFNHFTAGEDNVPHTSGFPRDQARWHALGMWPLAYEEGEVTKVFSHQVSRSYQFEDPGFLATGLGAVEVRGPYKPPFDLGSPAHWLTQMIVTDAGDTDPATEAGYIIRRKAWMSAAQMPDVDLTVNPDSGHRHGGASRMSPPDVRPASTPPSAVSMAGSSDDVNITGTTQNHTGADGGHGVGVWDGIDSLWFTQERNAAWYDVSPGWGLRKIRINSPEGFLDHVLVDDRRFVNELGAVIGQGVSSGGYALASDEAGRVFYGHRNTNGLPAGNRINIIDVRKQARWIQRPSGSTDGVDTDRFVVDVGDEFHAMNPFVADDATNKTRLRIVSSPVGNNGVYRVAAHVDGQSVDLFAADGVTPAVLAEEEDITWHWCVVDKPPVDHSVGDLAHLLFDKLHGRLWAIGIEGIQHTDDYGATWSTLFNESTVGGQVPGDALHRTNIFLGSRNIGTVSYCVDPQGSLYWIDSNAVAATTHLNKLTINNGIGTDQEYSRLQLAADFPVNGTKPARLDWLFWEKGVDNPTAIIDGAAPGGVRGMGAIWITHATGGNRDVYRMVCSQKTLDAGDITAFNSAALPIDGGTANLGNPISAPVSFDGDTIFAKYNDGAIPSSAWIYQPALGEFVEVTSNFISAAYYPGGMRPNDGSVLPQSGWLVPVRVPMARSRPGVDSVLGKLDAVR